MQTYYSLNDVTITKVSAVTIGNFDGVHLGHQHIIRSMVEAAKACGRQSIVITFFPNPKEFSCGGKFLYLTSNDQKLELIQKLGVDITIILEFNRELMHIRAAEFINLLISKLALRDLWIGHDFQFGYQREGDANWLQRLDDALGITVHNIDPVLVDGLPVSSSRIREAFRAGEMAQVRACLGRHFQKEVDLCKIPSIQIGTGVDCQDGPRNGLQRNRTIFTLNTIK